MFKLILVALASLTIHSTHAHDQGSHAFQTERIKRIHGQLAATHQKQGLGTPYPTLVIHESEWPIDPESFAFEETSLPAESAVHIHKPWASSSSDDAIAFALAHEAGHGLCQHHIKTLGIYALRSKAVGADLRILATGMLSDSGFKFVNESTESAMEIEADSYAALAMRDAGYDPLHGLDLALSNSTGGFGHPNGRDRRERASATLRGHDQSKSYLMECQRREPQSY